MSGGSRAGTTDAIEGAATAASRTCRRRRNLRDNNPGPRCMPGRLSSIRRCRPCCCTRLCSTRRRTRTVRHPRCTSPRPLRRFHRTNRPRCRLHRLRRHRHRCWSTHPALHFRPPRPLRQCTRRARIASRLPHTVVHLHGRRCTCSSPTVPAHTAAHRLRIRCTRRPTTRGPCRTPTERPSYANRGSASFAGN